MKYIVYYRIYGGEDAIIKYRTLEVMQNDVGTKRPNEFDYINACILDEDGNEEIVFSGHKEIMNAR